LRKDTHKHHHLSQATCTKTKHLQCGGIQNKKKIIVFGEALRIEKTTKMMSFVYV
jgi:hypothetical protein